MKYLYSTIILLLGGIVHSAERDPLHQRLIPADKGVDAEALVLRESAPVWTGAELRFAGMPVSGIGTGQLYLGGDGRLWYWGLFNEDDVWSKCEGYRYLFPSDPDDFRPVEQGFGLAWSEDGRREFRPLDARGFRDIAFRPDYPVGRVTYEDPAVPFRVELNAYTPTIPMDLEQSTYPATVFDFTVRSTGTRSAEVDLLGWMENVAGDSIRFLAQGERVTALESGDGFNALVASVSISEFTPAQSPREDVVFEGFDGGSFGEWEIVGEGFGSGPGLVKGRPGVAGDPEGLMAHSLHPGDEALGSLVSKPFRIERPFINLRMASGRMPHATGVRLLVDGKPVRLATGIKPRRLIEATMDVGEFLGSEARLEIFDSSSEDGAYVAVDRIVFSDTPLVADAKPEHAGDLGEMALALIGDRGPDIAVLDASAPPDAALAGDVRPGTRSTAALTDRPIGSLGRSLALEPGEEKTVTFVLSWRFPNRGPNQLRTYGVRWPDVLAQVESLAGDLETLRRDTELFAETWRDSTLPHWLLNRILFPIGALQTDTVIDTNGRYRFTFLEGSNSLGGNCTHVWHYAQGVARLWPEIERINRLEVELGLGFTRDGQIKFRVGHPPSMTALDGTTGTILRVLREHQMSSDNSFLQEAWPRTKQAMEYIIKTYDSDEDGITTGWQHNTLDSEWAGNVPWLNSLYLAALEASAEMARLMDDEAFAAYCEEIVASGREKFVPIMWNEDFGYFVMIDAPGVPRTPPNRRPIAGQNSPGTFEGSHIDQLLGEWWLGQVGLDPVLPEDKTRRALESLYAFNFTPDIGVYREVFEGGRWYAAPGEPGLMMTTFPFGGGESFQDAKGAQGYLNENMTGFEWAAAAAMIQAGLVTEGLAVAKAIDERYAPEKRNPFNEIECGDHYGRALASYSVLVALAGFEVDGPRQMLGFAPRITPDDFRSFFAAPEGWGTFSQKRTSDVQAALIEVEWGEIPLRILELELPGEASATSVAVTLGDEPVSATSVAVTLGDEPVSAEWSQDGKKISLRFAEARDIRPGEDLKALISF